MGEQVPPAEGGKSTKRRTIYRTRNRDGCSSAAIDLRSPRWRTKSPACRPSRHKQLLRPLKFAVQTTSPTDPVQNFLSSLDFLTYATTAMTIAAAFVIAR